MSQETLELIHFSIASSKYGVSIGGAKFFILFEDDCSKKLFVYFMKTMDDVCSTFLTFQAFVQKQTGKQIKSIATRENLDDTFTRYLNTKFVMLENRISDAPEKLLEMAKIMLNKACLDNALWAEAVSTAVYMINRTTLRNSSGKSSNEIWYGQMPYIAHIRPFGSDCIIHHMSHLNVMKIVGYDRETGFYRCLELLSRIIIKSKNVKFLDKYLNLDSRNILNDFYRVFESIEISENAFYYVYDDPIKWIGEREEYRNDDYVEFQFS